MLKINFSKQAEKFLLAVPAKHGRQIAGKISILISDPDALQSIELRGYAPWRRVKSGEYRIIYRIDGNDLNIDIIGKRNDDEVYRLIKRFLR